jgi:hypothetical protein
MPPTLGSQIIKTISKRVKPFFLTKKRFLCRRKYHQKFEVRPLRGAILQKWDFSLRKVPLFYCKDPFPPNSNSSASLSSTRFMNSLPIFCQKPLLSKCLSFGEAYALNTSLKNNPCKSREFWQNRSMAGKVFCHEEIKVHRDADTICKRRLKLFYSIE